MVLTFSFFNDLKNAQKAEYPVIVKKHHLVQYDIERVAEILKAGKLEEEWFKLLYIECEGCGLLNADLVLRKYSIADEGIKERLRSAWIYNTNMNFA